MRVNILRFSSAQEELGDLLRGGRNQCQANDHAPLKQGREVCVEDRLEEGDSGNDEEQEDRCANRVLHPLVGEQANAKDRGALRADGVGAE